MPEIPQFDPALVLTAAGATIAAGVIASVIELLKRVPAIGPWIDAKREPGVAIVATAALYVYCYLAVTPVPDLASAGAAFIAFLGTAALTSKAHDVAATMRG